MILYSRLGIVCPIGDIFWKLSITYHGNTDDDQTDEDDNGEDDHDDGDTEEGNNEPDDLGADRVQFLAHPLRNKPHPPYDLYVHAGDQVPSLSSPSLSSPWTKASSTSSYHQKHN